MGQKIQVTLDSLRSKAETNPVACVMFSGGKDSFVCLDLVSRSFKKVICVMMELSPGLDINTQYVDYAVNRYGCEVHRIRHWSYYQYIRSGIYYWEVYDSFRVPDIKIRHIYGYVRDAFDDPVIIVGSKIKDGHGGGKKFSILRNKDGITYPIKDWNKYEVLSYLKYHNIPIQQIGDKVKISNGISLERDCLLWLYRNHNSDYLKIQKDFPFVQAVIEREEMYGKE